GPLIVVGDEQQRQFVYAGKVHRFPDVALGGSTVAEQANCNVRLLSKLERIGDARGLLRLRPDRNAVGEIVRVAGGTIAAVGAAPKQKNLLHLRSAPEQGAIVAVGGKQHVLLAHGAGNADRDRFLTERDRVGPEAAGALEGDCLEVEYAREHHAAIKREQRRAIGGKVGERPQHRAVWRKVAAPAHREACNDGEPFVGHRSYDSCRSPAATNLPVMARKLRDSAPSHKRLGRRQARWLGLPRSNLTRGS